jgi:hypothetical protein
MIERKLTLVAGTVVNDDGTVSLKRVTMTFSDEGLLISCQEEDGKPEQ